MDCSCYPKEANGKISARRKRMILGLLKSGIGAEKLRFYRAKNVQIVDGFDALIIDGNTQRNREKLMEKGI